MRCSMYSGADILVGRLKFSESCHRYSNLQTGRQHPMNMIHRTVLRRARAKDLLVRSLHLRTALRRAELCDRAIQQIDLIVEIDDCDSSAGTHALSPRSQIRSQSPPLTANHSFTSSPSGNLTAFLKLPLPSVASANCRSCQLLVPLFAFCGRKGPRARAFLPSETSISIGLLQSLQP